MSQYLKEASATARAAGKLLLKYYRKRLKVDTKTSRTDLVTNADRASEKLICRRLHKAFPKHDIIAEEEHRLESGSRHQWFVDPLDGTINFVHSFPVFSVSIGLLVDGKPTVGAIYQPLLDEMFTAEAGRGAYLNGRRIRVSKTPKLNDSFLVTGFPYFDTGREDNLKYFKSFLTRTRAIRRIGSAAIDLAYTACGIFDGFWEFGLSGWDITAGTVIVQEAGGRVSGFDGKPVKVETGEILATNGRVHRSMLGVLRRGGPYRRRP